MIDLDKLKDIVISAAREELLTRFTRVERGIKADGSIITEADIATQQRIENELKLQWPDIDFLGEEMEPGKQLKLLKSDHPLWVLDPLDGTSNFSIGIPYFSISLALVENGRVTLGMVYDPCRDECFTACSGYGAFLNNEKLTTVNSGLKLKETTALIDYKRLPSELATRIYTEKPFSSQRSFGSVALDWCWIAAGRSNIYMHGKQNIWDYAAGYRILHEAGGHACTLLGEDVFVNDLIPRSAVAALDKKLFVEWTNWLDISAHS